LKTFAALAGSVLLSASAGAAAYDRGDANFTGSLASNNGAVSPTGTLAIQPYIYYSETRREFDNQGNRHAVQPSRSWRSIIVTTYSLTNALSVAVVPSFSRSSSNGAVADSFRLGDTTLRFQYMLQAPNADGTRPAISLAASHRFATGKYDRLGNNPLIATGTGAEVNTLGFFYQQYAWLPNGRPLRLRANVNWSPRPGLVGIRHESAYGTERGFTGMARPGVSVNALLAAEYSINKVWALATDLIYTHASGTWLNGTDAAGQPVNRMGNAGSQWAIAPAVEYTLNGNVGFIAGTQFAFAGRRTGATVTPQASVVVVF
jgi:hypothetical protein